MFMKFLCQFFSFSFGKYQYPFCSKEAILIDKNAEKTHVGTEKFAIDFLVPEGSLVCSAGDGTVVLIVEDHHEGGNDEKYATKANHLVISHGEEFSFYFHLAYHGALVKVGQKVSEGQMIAIQGSTGYTSEPHIHFAIYRNGHSVRPRFKH